MLYARTIMNWDDVLSLMCGGVRSASDGSESYAQRVKPAVYTYVIFASEHARMHSNCAEGVWYSGELHP